MSIRDAINQLPSWPGFVLGAIAIVGIGGWYYGTTFMKCVEVREGRELLRDAIDRAAAAGTPVLDLANAVPGDWDEVRIVQAHNPGQTPLNCPFGWDMTWRERQALVDAGQYTVIGFFSAGQFDRYIEYRSDWAVFIDPPSSLVRSAAQFSVEGARGGKPIVLRMMK